MVALTSDQKRQRLQRAGRPITRIQYQALSKDTFQNIWWAANKAIFCQAARAKWPNILPQINGLINDFEAWGNNSQCSYLVYEQGINKAVAVVNDTEANGSHITARYILTNGASAGLGALILTTVLQWSDERNKSGQLRLIANNDFLENLYTTTYGFTVHQASTMISGAVLHLNARTSPKWISLNGTWLFRG